MPRPPLLTLEQGKGYPDLVTRSFLNMVHTIRPTMPIHALVDFDPDGINIMRCYKWGSAALEHEEALELPSLRWLGVKSSDLHDAPGRDQAVPPPFGPNTASQEDPIMAHEATYSRIGSCSRLVRLTQRDRKLAIKLLGDLADMDGRDTDVAEARRELQVILMMNVKVEIQAMNDEGDVAGYLERKLVEEAR